MRAAGWTFVGVIGAVLALGRAHAQSEPAPPTAAPPAAPAGPIEWPSTGPDWVAPEAGGPIPESLPAEAEPAQPPSAADQPPAPAPPPPVKPERRPGEDAVFKDWGKPGASPPPDLGPPIQAALMLGIGATLNETPGSINALGFGFGMRGSYRILPEVVVGGRFLYFIGGSSTLPTGEISMSSWQLAAEAAYVVPLTDTIDLEPGVVIGMNVLAVRGPRTAFLEAEGSGFVPGSSQRTEAALYFAPGAAIRIPIKVPDVDNFFVGGDARLGFQFRDAVGTSIELMGQTGMRF